MIRMVFNVVNAFRRHQAPVTCIDWGTEPSPQRCQRQSGKQSFHSLLLFGCLTRVVGENVVCLFHQCSCLHCLSPSLLVNSCSLRGRLLVSGSPCFDGRPSDGRSRRLLPDRDPLRCPVPPQWFACRYVDSVCHCVFLLRVSSGISPSC